MKKSLIYGLSSLSLFFMSNLYAVSNAPVSIVYPIMGASYENYVEFSFAATCKGGPHALKWHEVTPPATYSDGAIYYDQISVQFSHKFPAGWHSIEVYGCNGKKETVRFFVL